MKDLLNTYTVAMDIHTSFMAPKLVLYMPSPDYFSARANYTKITVHMQQEVLNNILDLRGVLRSLIRKRVINTSCAQQPLSDITDLLLICSATRRNSMTLWTSY